jgi:hypothetical protein
MASNIPEARKILEDLLDRNYDQQEAIRQALRLMTREITKPRRAYNYRDPVTAEKVNGVQGKSRDDPDLSCDQLGIMYGIDGGRVSEIIAGKHDHLTQNT